MSNPTSQYFTIGTESNSKHPINVRVTDDLGRIVELRNNIVPNSKWQIGNNYRRGIYTMEILQGDVYKTVKLLKL